MNSRSVITSRAGHLLIAAGIAIVTLAAASRCAAGSSPTEPSQDQRTLAVGQTTSIAEGTTITFDRVISDSRCAAGLTCVWEGEVTVALTLRRTDGATPFTLSDHDQPKIAGGFTFELVSVQPGRVADQEVPQSAYRITIRATR